MLRLLRLCPHFVGLTMVYEDQPVPHRTVRPGLKVTMDGKAALIARVLLMLAAASHQGLRFYMKLAIGGSCGLTRTPCPCLENRT